VAIKRAIPVSGDYDPQLTNLAGYTSSLPMSFAAEAHIAEGQFRLLKSTLNEIKSLKI
jgi:hypothetical protein